MTFTGNDIISKLELPKEKRFKCPTHGEISDAESLFLTVHLKDGNYRSKRRCIKCIIYFIESTFSELEEINDDTTT